MKEFEDKINSIQPGNYLKYAGPHFAYNDSIGQLIRFREIKNNEQAYLLQLFDYKKAPTVEIVAYPADVREMPLQEEQIIKAGFVKDGSNSIYHLGRVTIFNIGAIRRDENSGGQLLELGGYFATTKFEKVPVSIAELDNLKAKSVYVGVLHQFQNMMKIYFPKVEVRY